MKRVLALILCLALAVSCMVVLSSCGDKETASADDAKTFEIAVVTDVGQLMDGGFNQGTYEGAKAYAEANGKTYQYYQPANGADATDNDRAAAMRQAIKNGAKVIVAPGFLQAAAMTTVALESPDVKFVFIDGWTLTDDAGNAIPNVTAVVYKEQESGYMAGYAAVMGGFTKLGGTFGGGGSNPACNRYGFGYVQGAAAAAAEKNVDIEVRYSYKFGDAFSASTELQSQIASWYEQGTEVVFSCGGSMFQSVKSAAEETPDGKIIGVDVDQAPLSDRVVTSAVKGLNASVQKILGEYYAGEWDAKLSGQTSNLGASDDATGLPTNFDRLNGFTAEQYTAMFDGIKDGSIAITAEVPEDCNDAAWLETAMKDNAHVTIVFEK